MAYSTADVVSAGSGRCTDFLLGDHTPGGEVYLTRPDPLHFVISNNPDGLKTAQQRASADISAGTPYGEEIPVF